MEFRSRLRLTPTTMPFLYQDTHLWKDEVSTRGDGESGGAKKYRSNYLLL